jgi:hypothetical protein
MSISIAGMVKKYQSYHHHDLAVDVLPNFFEIMVVGIVRCINFATRSCNVWAFVRPFYTQTGELKTFPERESVHQMLACYDPAALMEDALRTIRAPRHARCHPCRSEECTARS